VRALLILILALFWLAAAAVLALAPDQTSTGLRVAAAVITGLPGALTAIWGFLSLIGKPPIRTRLKVKWMLKAGLIDVYHNGPHRGDISQISFHVWIVPLFWRLFPARIRRRSKVESRMPSFFRARLVRFTSYRLEHKEHSNISRFRLGKGLVGRCAASNEESEVHVVRFYEDEFQEAIQDEPSWNDARASITQGISRELAIELARKYSQAAAVVVQKKGAPVGCVTVSLPPVCTVNLPEDREALRDDPRVEALLTTAKLVERELAL
jgi:hypothetical protein